MISLDSILDANKHINYWLSKSDEKIFKKCRHHGMKKRHIFTKYDRRTCAIFCAGIKHRYLRFVLDDILDNRLIIDRLPYNSVITLTFSERIISYYGSTAYGNICKHGYDKKSFKIIKDRFNALGAKVDTYNLLDCCDFDTDVEFASVLVIRNGVNILLNEVCQDIDADTIHTEQLYVDVDKEFYNKGKVCKKVARYNCIFADFSKEPDHIGDKTGRVVDFRHVPTTNILRDQIQKYCSTDTIKYKSLLAEGNYYYNPSTCYIKFHGDTERKRVIGVRLGSRKYPLIYCWYNKGIQVGTPAVIMLNPGDIYIMSEYTVGNNWKSKLPFTLRHAAGELSTIYSLYR